MRAEHLCRSLFHCPDKDPHTQTYIDSNVEHQIDTPTDEQNVSFRWMLHIHLMHYIHLALNGANRYAHRNANNIKRNFHTLYIHRERMSLLRAQVLPSYNSHTIFPVRIYVTRSFFGVIFISDYINEWGNYFQSAKS